MKDTHWMYNVYLLLTSAVVIQGASLTVEEVADNLATKRGFKNDDYAIRVVRGHLRLNRGDRVPSGHYIRRRDLTGSRESFSLQLEKGQGEQTVIDLEPTPSVLHPNAKVLITHRDFVQTWQGQKPDCFYTGHIKDSPFQSASFSFCNTMMGTFNDDTMGYWVEALNATDQEDPSQEHILIASKALTKINDHAVMSNGGPVRCGENNAHCEFPNEKVRRSTKNRSPKKTTELLESSSKDRSARSVPDKVPWASHARFPRTVPTVTIEMAVVVDNAYVNKLSEGGHTTTADWTQLMLIKLNAAQIEWGRSDQLQYDVRLSVKLLEFWAPADPTNYEFVPEETLANFITTLSAYYVHLGKYQEYDHVHHFTGTSPHDVSGVAYQNTICHQPNHIALTTWTGIIEIKIMPHEMGHQFNMVHDTSDCSSGLMGVVSFGWSDCSIASFLAKMSTSDVDCLSKTNVNLAENVTLESRWPGMSLTNNEVCALKAGVGYEYRAYPYNSWDFCTQHSCVNMDRSSAEYMAMKKFLIPLAGTYCADGKVCSPTTPMSPQVFYDCITYSETGLDSSYFTVVTGGWSAWGAMSSCSRTCGTGVQYRQRECNNPKPMFSAGCPGSRYDASLCNTGVCPGEESANAATLRSLRASETCAYLKNNNIYEVINENSANYAETGSRFWHENHGQCEVTCDTIGGYSPPVNSRFGLMPDGVGCSTDTTNSFVETNNLPRAVGKTGYCVQGYCEEFNCADTNSENSKDGCGVCQGDGSTCTVTEQVFSTTVANGVRVTMVTIPSESFLIQAWFEYSGMNEFYIELYDENDTPIIATKIPGDSAIESGTKTFANTDWTYRADKQYLYAPGPTNQIAVLKLFNFGSNTNLGVSYGYSGPPGATSATTTTTSAATTTTATTTTVSSAASTTSSATSTVSTGTTTESTDNGAGHLGHSGIHLIFLLLVCLCAVTHRL